MAGIAGIFHAGGKPATRQAITAAGEAMRYRGPDGITHWIGARAALAHCRMCTTPESLEECQPAANDASEDAAIVLVMDGFLSNWEELRRDFTARGIRLRNRSDAELALRAYEVWGEDCPRHLDGEFALIVSDARNHSLFACTDHQGLRTLHWHWDGATLFLATDVAGVLAAMEQAPSVNLGYFTEILADEWYSLDETVWKGVMRLPPAHSLRLGRGEPRLTEYWQVSPEISIVYADERDYAEHYRELLFDCVRRTSRSHLPLAIEVSGGLDSSALYCVGHELDRQGRLLAPEMRGYALAGIPGTGSDELAYVNAVEEHVGRVIQREPLFLAGLDWYERRSRLDRDLPPRPNAAMGLNMQQRLVADGCRVSINGHGGDQWLDGTQNYYFEMMAAGQWKQLASAYGADCRSYGWRPATGFLTRYGIWQFAPDGLRRLRKALAPQQNDDCNGWVLSPQAGKELAERKDRYFAPLPKPARLRYKQQKHLFPYLPLALSQGERQLAHVGAEPRSPMLSRAFIEFSAATPEHIRLRGGERRRVHRTGLRGILPELVRNRADKAEFSASIEHSAAEFTKFVTQPMPTAIHQLIDSEDLSKILSSYCNAPIDQRPLWQVWSLYEIYLILRLNQPLEVQNP
ncbi:lasso peptide isopeptide bond-forming cyclase [Alteraurantiacibacter aestuarii]|uniref:asparagine synthase (glutamine-hydrolyzing) n=1 Tax=Alteraurantiacibacter aestuarii TaxID=650004 RepID=A0A844ZS40_9SPHN|nr:asparagine synthetase B [Alteraurantiacibacter aestuarii]MXO88419.1 hypothetical protein [Alteraurantiacibacter aestuarii]